MVALPAGAGGGARRRPTVVAVIPARDEAEVIGRAVASLLAQNYDGFLHIVLVDDQSSDGTAEAARAAAETAGARDRMTVRRGQPVPPGWTGKLWAVRQGVETARSLSPDYILLTDADIVHGPGNLRELVSRSEVEDYDLVSLMVRLHCRGLWERLLIPAFVFFFFKLYPPHLGGRSVPAAPRGRRAGACSSAPALDRSAGSRHPRASSSTIVPSAAGSDRVGSLAGPRRGLGEHPRIPLLA